MKTVFRLAILVLGLGLLAVYAAPTRAQSAPRAPTIESISICDSSGTVATSSCPGGTKDTYQKVLSINGGSINKDVPYATDEHSSIIPPQAGCWVCAYRFFVSSGTRLNSGIGLAVLASSLNRPPFKPRWQLGFDQGTGHYCKQPGDCAFGTVFRAPMVKSDCPANNQTRPDSTFDLNSAAGSVVIDPTAPTGNLLLVYEGVNGCIGSKGSKPAGNGFSTIGVATSLDSGVTWPTYNGRPNLFTFTPLPYGNTTQGPDRSLMAFGNTVRFGNDRTSTPPQTYGRYAVIAQSETLASALKLGLPFCGPTGELAPSAFVDDLHPGGQTYLYVVHNYIPGVTPAPGATCYPSGGNHMAISRALLNGGKGALTFSPGLGGTEQNILANYTSTNDCGNPNHLQKRTMGSISYLQDTKQYILFFVCDSLADPRPLPGEPNPKKLGAAWMYSVSKDTSDSTNIDLSDPAEWGEPQEVVGSWEAFEDGVALYKGWYPTFMSLALEQDHLTTTGYVFYTYGCPSGINNCQQNPRYYSSRSFTITTSP